MPAKTKTTESPKREKIEEVRISSPRIQTAEFHIVGTAPYIQLRFSEKAINAMREKHEAGSLANKKKAKAARDFHEDFLQAQHISDDKRPWNGIPASAFRNATISACRLVGFKMTLAKLSIFIQPDGFDKVDGVPLIKIKGKPESHLMHARNATGVCDLRVRAKFWPWSAEVRVQYDADQFSATDMANLMTRVGTQVGIGEGRPDSKMSAGMGWGTFKLG
jgi:hypothetical protein